MTLFKIPIFIRRIEMRGEGGEIMPRMCQTNAVTLHIDGVGVEIIHDGRQALTTDLIRHHLCGREKSYALVEAENVRKVILRFYREWEGALIGGRSEQSKAIWIDRGQDRLKSFNPPTITELPECEKIHFNNRGECTCGRPINEIKDDPFYEDQEDNNSGEWGMCVHEGYDAPEGDCCPMNAYWEYSRDLPTRTITVNGKDYYYTTPMDEPERELTHEEKLKLGRGAFIEWKPGDRQKKKSIQKQLAVGI